MRHRHALLLAVTISLAPFAPVFFSGDVIFPHDNSVEVGLHPANLPHASRNFSDLSSSSIPELQHQLRGDRESWIATWNPHVELGRPSFQINGLSKAFVLTWLISLVSDDALSVYAWLSLITVVLTSVFAYLFLRESDLHPAACLSGSLGVGMGVFTAHWLSFVMFISSLCWTLALLWGVQRFLRRATAASFVGIVFAIHAFLLSGFPQQILWHALLVSGFTVAELRARPGSLRSRLRSTAQLAVAVALGLLSVAPVYLDFAINLAESSRVGTQEAGLFLPGQPLGSRPYALLLALGQWIDASWFGDIRTGGFLSRFRGLVLTPVFAVLLAISFSSRRMRAMWPWQLLVVVCLVTSVSRTAHTAGVHSGLIISRSLMPLAAAIIPVMILTAHTADHLIRAGSARRFQALLVGLLPLVVMLATCVAFPELVRPGSLAIGLALYAGSLAFVRMPSPALLIGLVVASCFVYAYPLVALRDKREIQLSSPLVKLLQRETADGSRYAWVFPDPDRGSLLPPNQEILLGLNSVHTYNSMTSRRYQAWATRNAQKRLIEGRRFQAFLTSGPWKRPDIYNAGIGALLSFETLEPQVGTLLSQIGDVRVHRPRIPPVHQGVFNDYSLDRRGSARVRRSLASKRHSAERVENREDRLRFRLPVGDRERLLVVSQQFHSQWRATSEGAALETLPVNDFYQGVLVPAETVSVELRFLPFTRFAWIPPVLFALCALGFGLRFARPQGVDRARWA